MNLHPTSLVFLAKLTSWNKRIIFLFGIIVINVQSSQLAIAEQTHLSYSPASSNPFPTTVFWGDTEQFAAS